MAASPVHSSWQQSFSFLPPVHPQLPSQPSDARPPGIFIFATKKGFTWGQSDVSEAQPIDTGQAVHTRSPLQVQARGLSGGRFPRAPGTVLPTRTRQGPGRAGRPRPHSGCSAHRDTLAGKAMTLPPTPPVSCDGTSIRLLAGGGLRALPLNVAGLCDYLIRSAWPGHSLRVFLGPSCHTARKPDRPVGRPEDMCRCPSHRPG